jgi:hypothetical protein
MHGYDLSIIEEDLDEVHNEINRLLEKIINDFLWRPKTILPLRHRNKPSPTLLPKN